MFGCFRAVGCLVVVAAVGVGAYATRDRWLPAVTGRAPAAPPHFERITDDRRNRARNAVASLERTSGPVFINLSAAEVSALVLAQAGTRLPAIVDRGEAAVQGDQLTVRATIDLSAFKGIAALGPFGALLDARQRIALTGGLEIIEPGRAQFVVKEVRVGDLLVPPQAIAPLIAQLDRAPRGRGVAASGIPFSVPPYIGDVRVGKGRVTLYKIVK